MFVGRKFQRSQYAVKWCTELMADCRKEIIFQAIGFSQPHGPFFKFFFDHGLSMIFGPFQNFDTVSKGKGQ